MGEQRWKSDPKLYDCKREERNNQLIKKIDYENVFIKEFLDQDPIRDWESFERCKMLWDFCLKKLNLTMLDVVGKTVLDCGTKDGQFPQYLRDHNINAVGIDVSKPYIEYAQSKGRPVIYGDVCNLSDVEDSSFDFVFSHHLLGLTSDYYKGLSEMFRVSKNYMITLNDIPGNKKKHYSYIDNPEILGGWLKTPDFIDHKVIYSGRNPYWKNKTEWILFLEKC